VTIGGAGLIAWRRAWRPWHSPDPHPADIYRAHAMERYLQQWCRVLGVDVGLGHVSIDDAYGDAGRIREHAEAIEAASRQQHELERITPRMVAARVTHGLAIPTFPEAPAPIRLAADVRARAHRTIDITAAEVAEHVAEVDDAAWRAMIDAGAHALTARHSEAAVRAAIADCAEAFDPLPPECMLADAYAASIRIARSNARWVSRQQTSRVG